MGINNGKMVANFTINGEEVEKLGEIGNFKIMKTTKLVGVKIYFVDGDNNVMSNIISISNKNGFLDKESVDVGMLYVKGFS